MSGYKQSSYEPNHWEPQGPPLRPYNRVQWTGVALVFVGIAVDLLYLAGRLGWIPKLVDEPVIAIGPLMLGVVLVNSRRQPISPEQCARQRRRALIVAAVGVVACAVGLAAIFYFKGA